MNDILDSILTGGVAVSLITLVGQLIMWYMKDGREKDSIPASNLVNPDHTIELDRFQNDPEIQYVIDRVLDRTSAHRFLILKTEDGGGKPRLGSHLYSSVIFEAMQSPLQPVKSDYQRLLVDDIYVRMLSDIGPSTPNKLKVGAMKDGLLKSIYLVEGVTYSEIHYIGETNNAFLYLSIATIKPDCTFDDPLDRVEIEIAISKIRTIFINSIKEI